MPQFFQFPDIQIACPACTCTVEAEINEFKDKLSIDSCVMNFDNKILTVTVNDSNTDPKETIRQNILTILKDNERISDLPPAPQPEPVENDKAEKELLEMLPVESSFIHRTPLKIDKKYHWQQAALGILSGTALMGIMFFKIMMPSWLHYSIIGLASLVTLGLGRASYHEALKGLTNKPKSVNMDTLFSISTIAAISLSIAHIFIPIMPMLVDAALMIFGFRHAGQWLEESVQHKTLEQHRFVDRALSMRYKDNKIPSKGSLIKIPMGGCIPLNGKLLSSSAEVKFTIHNGETDPYTLKENATLKAGMICASEELLMEATASQEDSYLHRRDLQLALAHKNKAPILNLTNKIMTWFLPAILIASATVGVVGGLLISPAIGMKAALYLLVCACPCVLGFITGLSIKIGMSKIPTESGIRFNHAKGIQAASNIDTFAFDLNGTLTCNKPEVIECTVPEKFFPIIDNMEQGIDHPIPKSIIAHMKLAQKSKMSFSIAKSHHGLTATDNINTYQIGNADFMNPQGDDKVADLKLGQHAIYFSVNDVIKGHFLIADPLRKDAAAFLHTLIKQHKTIKILTGTNRLTADLYAKQLQIDPSRIIAGCTPESKQVIVRQLKNIDPKTKVQGNHVCFVGDSANDSTAVTEADLGIAVISPASDDETTENADLVITNDSLSPLLTIFPVAQQTMSLIKQNLYISFAYNVLSLGFIGCAIFFLPAFLNPAFGAGFMVVQSAIVLANAYRIKHQNIAQPEIIQPQIKEENIQINASESESNVSKKIVSFRESPSPSLQNVQVVNPPLFSAKLK